GLLPLSEMKEWHGAVLLHEPAGVSRRKLGFPGEGSDGAIGLTLFNRLYVVMLLCSELVYGVSELVCVSRGSNKWFHLPCEGRAWKPPMSEGPLQYEPTVVALGLLESHLQLPVCGDGL